MFRFAPTNDTPYLAAMGEIWGIFRELYEEKWPRYIESALVLVRRYHNTKTAAQIARITEQYL